MTPNPTPTTRIRRIPCIQHIPLRAIGLTCLLVICQTTLNISFAEGIFITPTPIVQLPGDKCTDQNKDKCQVIPPKKLDCKKKPKDCQT